MGNLLVAPKTEKETHVGKTHDGLDYGVSSMQGWRIHMEDAHITEGHIFASEVVTDESSDTLKYNRIDLPGHSLFAVFDGHGGTYAAMYAGRNFCRVLSRQQKFIEYAKFILERPAKEETLLNQSDRDNYLQTGIALLQEALTNAFVELDKEIACALKGHRVPDADVPYSEESNDSNSTVAHVASNKNGSNTVPVEGAASSGDSAMHLLEDEGDSGTTACVVLITPDWVVCANAGDSRSVLSTSGNTAVPLSYDHKPDDEPEERRIRACGGYVAGGRVEGDLAVSRGLGDYRFKNIPVVMAIPFSGIQVPDNFLPSEIFSDNQTLNMKPCDQKVSPIPDVRFHNRNEALDEFIIVACDGIWDVQTNYEAVKTVADMFKEGESDIGLICEEVSA
jgi:serine/threonine protein phosphatase PrpC